jgi:hypothetical protein
VINAIQDKETEMKTFKLQCAQGDVWFRRVNEIPRGSTKKICDDGPIVIAYSETHHHHVFRDPMGVTLYERTDDPFTCYLRLETPQMLEHLREFDTHAPILFDAGCYEIRRQREFTPEGLRMVAD